MKKLSSAALIICALTSATPAFAASVGASGTTSFFWYLENAFDANGDLVDATGLYTITGPSSIATSSGTNQPGQVSSNQSSATIVITNTSTNFTMNFTGNLEMYAGASGFNPTPEPGESYFDSNVFMEADGYSLFAAVTSTSNCTNNDANSPNFDCFEVNEFNSDSYFDTLFRTLLPGESLSLVMNVQSFATQRFEPISAVPVPAALPLLATALGAMGVMARNRKRGAAKAIAHSRG
jgi:hypothetical protein